MRYCICVVEQFYLPNLESFCDQLKAFVRAFSYLRRYHSNDYQKYLDQILANLQQTVVSVHAPHRLPAAVTSPAHT
jgi:hypothetical protein